MTLSYGNFTIITVNKCNNKISGNCRRRRLWKPSDNDIRHRNETKRFRSTEIEAYLLVLVRLALFGRRSMHRGWGYVNVILRTWWMRRRGPGDGGALKLPSRCHSIRLRARRWNWYKQNCLLWNGKTSCFHNTHQKKKEEKKEKHIGHRCLD